MSSPVSDGNHLKIDRQQIGTVHTGRSSGFRTKDGIFAAEQFISISQVKSSEAFHNIPGGSGNRGRVRIIFTEIIYKKVLIGGMTARINR